MFNLHSGAFIGIALAISLLIAISSYGERLILILAKARYVVDDEVLINQVKNFCCHLEIPEVKVYWSNSFSNNIYFAKTYNGVPILVIGKTLYQQLTRNELNAMIYASLLKIRMRSTEHRTVLNLVFFMMYSPLFLTRSLVKKEAMFSFLNLFLYSASIIQAWAFPNMSDVMKFDFVVTKLSGLKMDYLSALVKISSLEEKFNYSACAMLFYDLTHIRNKSHDVVFDLLTEKIDLPERVRELSLAK